MDDTFTFGWFEPPKSPKKPKKTGKQLRNEGMDEVLKNEHGQWKADYENGFNRLGIGWLGTAEDFKIICLERGMKHPHHPSCWSSAWGFMVRQGRLEFMREWRTSVLASRHANSAKIWMKTV
jgi:hypothetical protein